jgi:hypothetical protein
MLDILDKLDNDTLCDVWCKLNKWEYPDFLKELEPQNWKELEMNEKSNIISPYMRHIETITTLKERSKRWNMYHIQPQKTEQEFEHFWKNRPSYNNNLKRINKINKIKNGIN